jgi:glycosyltransferase involved in cell wall biosynthesis
VNLSALVAWSICIFACNEERLLPRCLAALERARGGGNYVVHVMENGSTDDTARVAREAADDDERLRVHELAVGDKASAWNEYVHGVAPKADMHVFIDGDIRPAAGAFEALARALESSPHAYAAAALPASGRSQRAWRERLEREHYLSGNLYALRGTTIDLFRERAIRLPAGAVGEDGLLSYLFVTDLKAGRDDSHRERIAVAEDAFFEFDSLKANPRDLAIYMKRLKRYSLRHFQKQVLYARLKEQGVAGLPRDINEIYTADVVARLAPRLDPVNHFVDRATLNRLRAKASA